METEHTETVVEKAVAYVKDMLGIAPSDKTPDVEAKPEYADTPREVTAEDAMRLDPNAYTRKSVADLNLERAPRALQEETIENHENIESAANEMRADKEPPADSELERTAKQAALPDDENRSPAELHADEPMNSAH
jgi:hypothetical protein